MPEVLETTASRRAEMDDLVMLFQATLDEPDASGCLVEACTVTAKIVRSRAGEIVALTRVTLGEQGVSQSRPPQAELEAVAQDLADRIIAQVRRYLGEEAMPGARCPDDRRPASAAHREG